MRRTIAWCIAAALVVGCSSSDSGGSTGPGDAGGSADTASTDVGTGCKAKPIVVSCTQEAYGTKTCKEYSGNQSPDTYIAKQCTTIGSAVATPHGTDPCDRSSADYFGSCLLGCGSPDEIIVAYYTTVDVNTVCTNQAGTWFDKSTPVR